MREEAKYCCAIGVCVCVCPAAFALASPAPAPARMEKEGCAATRRTKCGALILGGGGDTGLCLGSAQAAVCRGHKASASELKITAENENARA